MNSITKKMSDRVSHLIDKSVPVLNSKYQASYKAYVDEAKYTVYRSQAIACLVDFLGEHHTYVNTLNSMKKDGHTFANAQAIKGILESLKEDLEKGYLQSLREIVHSEIFTDFIEMAEYLLGQGYKDPAAVIIGSVLEEHLRQLCDKNGVTRTFTDKNGDLKNKKASQINDELCKAQAYLSTQQKQVTAWLGLRNEAAHGKYGSYTEMEIKAMLTGIVGFLTQYPA